MARKLRIEYEGALHHVINRGNYRRELFEMPGAAEAFLKALFEAADRHGWRVHAYVLMNNHFHLAVETSRPNLGLGMQWLQGTLATRFNRFRNERGHLFQGRYHSLVLEDFAVLARVVDYIHLNPVRAKLVAPEEIMNHRLSSLAVLGREERPKAFCAADWLAVQGLADDAAGHTAYVRRLLDLGRDEAAWKQAGLEGLSRGWALGTDAWRRALAKDQAALKLTPGLAMAAIKEVNEASWELALDRDLAQSGRSRAELKTRPKNTPWKIELARKLRNECGASIVWLATTLHLGQPASARSYLSRSSSLNQQTTLFSEKPGARGKKKDFWTRFWDERRGWRGRRPASRP